MELKESSDKVNNVKDRELIDMMRYFEKVWLQI